MRRSILALITALLLLVSVASAEQAKLDLSGLSWLSGTWSGEAFGGVCEESWTSVSGGTMTGTFKLIHSDKGRTNPSISSVLGKECTCQRLDVIGIDDEFLNLVL